MAFDATDHNGGGGDGDFHDEGAMTHAVQAGILSMTATAMANDVCVRCSGVMMMVSMIRSAKALIGNGTEDPDFGLTAVDILSREVAELKFTCETAIKSKRH